jgi:hypothetical protein
VYSMQTVRNPETWQLYLDAVTKAGLTTELVEMDYRSDRSVSRFGTPIKAHEVQVLHKITLQPVQVVS